MDWYQTLFEMIDMRSFSNLWFWIALAVMWSTASHWVLGVPFDMVLRARRHGEEAQADLEDMVRHHLDPIASLNTYRLDMATLPVLSDTVDDRIMSSEMDIAAIAEANELEPLELSDAEVQALLAFLKALEDPAMRLGVPKTVPSGLPVEQ